MSIDSRHVGPSIDLLHKCTKRFRNVHIDLFVPWRNGSLDGTLRLNLSNLLAYLAGQNVNELTHAEKLSW